MEQLETQKKQWHDIDITGRWLLLYEVRNSMGPQAFGGKHIGTYESPFDKTKVYRKSVNGEPLNGYMVDKIATKLTPDTDPDHKLLISFLICSPEVQLEGIKNVNPIILAAKTGTKLTLKCLDALELENIDDEDFIDKVISRVIIENGKDAIGIAKLRSVLAALNQPYSDSRYSGNQEAKALRSKLKSFIRKNKENAEATEKVLNDLDGSKDNLNFKEALRLRIIEDYNGVYKFNKTPLGSSPERVYAFFVNNPEVKAEILQVLYAAQKNEDK